MDGFRRDRATGTTGGEGGAQAGGAPNHIHALLESGDPGATAISAPGRDDLSYDGLRRQVRRTVAALNARGIGRGDRVAIVLPNGPEMAAAFVAIAAGAATAPLNPAYRRPEFEFYLSDLRAKAVVLAEGDESPARAAAAALGIATLDIRVPPGSPAGVFAFAEAGAGGAANGGRDDGGTPSGGGGGGRGGGDPDGDAHSGSAPAACRTGMAGPDDVALVLHTSGTTSRPKIVPLLHRNVCATAEHIRRTLRLESGDRCLNVMPLFHIHGLMACVLATLHSGGSVYCAPGFNALKVFGWLADANPTWYSAVPTMHQTILARAPRNREVVEALRLRFIRSSSAALPARVMGELEETFAAPVVEAYAMTEAAHQMTCNPLPPAPRKPGTVGIAAGPEVSVMNAAGALLGPGEEGEIVIRGPNVTPGYENNEAANRECFTGGWFRTGDQGFRDDEGYFTITGRLKEIINRGGEKISPREVDEVLMAHPAVQQVVTFAMPHPKLGEEVAAAVVLREGMEAAPGEVRDFATGRLAGFKVPRKVVVLDEIPKGPTGKLRRIGLAEKLGLGSAGGESGSRAGGDAGRATDGGGPGSTR